MSDGGRTAGAPTLRGVGLDVVDLERFTRSARQRGFLEHMCTAAELARLPEEEHERLRLAACCFAYKEAVLKALGTGAWQQGTSFFDVEVLLGEPPEQPPALHLCGGVARVLAAGGGGRLQLAHFFDEARVVACCLWWG